MWNKTATYKPVDSYLFPKKVIALLVTILFAVNIMSAHAQGSWVRKADFKGKGRIGVTVFSIDNKGYMGLGGLAGEIPHKDFWEYDPVTDVWTQKANFGAGNRMGARGFSIGTKGYIGTGNNPDAVGYKDFWEYDPISNNWTRKADFAGGERAGVTAFSIGNKGYIGLGINSEYTYENDFWEYDPVTDVWTRKADFGGLPRNGAFGFSIGNNGYIGTGNNYDTPWFRDFWQYDPVINKWTQKSNYPGKGQTQLAGFSIGNKGYAGIGTNSDLVFQKDFWEYNPALDQWTEQADLGGVARRDLVGFNIADKGYIGAGISTEYPYTYQNDFWEFTPDNSQAITKATIPITAVSFPKEVFPINAGKLDFWAKLSDFSGDIPVGGVAPHFFFISEGEKEGGATDGHTYWMGFNANDGLANGGLIGSAGIVFHTGTGYFDGWTYEDILGEGKVADWHHYVFQWSKDGIKGVTDGKQKVAIFVDGVLNSGRWAQAENAPGVFEAFTSCPTLNLISLQHPGDISGEIAMDEFKIFDGNDNLVLYNTLGSKSEIEHSAVGLNGAFNAGGNAHFVQGVSGMAVMATPVYGIGTPDCKPETIVLSCPKNKGVPTDKGVCKAIVSGIDPVLTPAGSSADVTYTLKGATTGSGKGSASGKSFNKGVTTITYTLAADASQSCSFNVTVQDKEAPVVTNVTVLPSTLWPPNHKLQEVQVDYTVTDNCGATATLAIKGNDGTNSGDWQVVDAHHVWLRSERSGTGNGRVYTITITTADASGNKSTETVAVVVPHDRSNKSMVQNGKGKGTLKFTVHPNPSQHDFTLQVYSSNDRPLSIRVTNAVGKLMEVILNTGAKGTVHLGSNYPTGTYFAEVVQGNSRAVVKLVKISD